MRAFSSCSEQGLLFVVVCGLLTGVWASHWDVGFSLGCGLLTGVWASRWGVGFSMGCGLLTGVWASQWGVGFSLGCGLLTGVASFVASTGSRVCGLPSLQHMGS